MPGGAAVQEVALGADHTVALLDNGGVVGFGRGHRGQVTGGTRGPHTVPVVFQWALSKTQPTAVRAQDDCTCMYADPKKPRNQGRRGLLGGGRTRAFGDTTKRCFGACPSDLVDAMFASMEEVL